METPSRLTGTNPKPATESFNLVQCGPSFSGQILAIFNDAIVNSTALYDYRPRTEANMAAWFESKTRGNYPVIGAVNAQGELLGFATYGMFRERPAYKYSVEHSVYVAAKHRGKGIGKVLLKELIAAAIAQEYHLLVGVIDAENHVSIELHKRFGFLHSGTLRESGFKFGKWLDAVFYTLQLPTPKHPVDG